MDNETVPRIISDFANVLVAGGTRPQKIVLFGSQSTGIQREHSDIDVVVISEDFASKGYWERTDILSAAIATVFQLIEAVAMTPQEWQSGDSVIADYARNGEIVYG